MTKELPQMEIKRKSGDERFHSGGDDLGFDLLSYWRWADSDLLGNTSRGRLAEYIVARAVGIGELDIANDWDAYDLVTPFGIKLEIKSSSYVQTWFQKGPDVVSKRFLKDHFQYPSNEKVGSFN